MLAQLDQLECPRGETQALHRQRLVLVLLAAPPRQHVEAPEVIVGRVVVVAASGVASASWMLYRQRLVLELLAPAPCQGQCLMVEATFQCC